MTIMVWKVMRVLPKPVLVVVFLFVLVTIAHA